MPRGVVAIAARCVCGRPAVVQTAPRLDDGSPFPTTFYLTLPGAVYGCSALEATHYMDELNQRLAEDEQLAAAYAQATRPTWQSVKSLVTWTKLPVFPQVVCPPALNAYTP